MQFLGVRTEYLSQGQTAWSQDAVTHILQQRALRKEAHIYK